MAAPEERPYPRMRVQFITEVRGMDADHTDVRRVHAAGMCKRCAECNELLAAPAQWHQSIILSARKYYIRVFKTKTERDEYVESVREELPGVVALILLVRSNATEIITHARVLNDNAE